MTKIYVYDTKTGELKRIRDARIDPLTGEELLPTPNIEGKTIIPPPTPEPGFVLRFNHKTQTWRKTKDWRGITVYEKASGADKKLDSFFDFDKPEDFTDKPRPSRWHNFDEAADDWVEDTAAKTAYEQEEQKDTDYSQEDAEKKNIWDKVDAMSQAEFKTFLQDFIVDFASAKRVLVNVTLEVARLRRKFRDRG